jgi:hypothetical protein
MRGPNYVGPTLCLGGGIVKTNRHPNASDLDTMQAVNPQPLFLLDEVLQSG